MSNYLFLLVLKVLCHYPGTLPHSFYLYLLIFFILHLPLFICLSITLICHSIYLPIYLQTSNYLSINLNQWIKRSISISLCTNSIKLFIYLSSFGSIHQSQHIPHFIGTSIYPSICIYRSIYPFMLIFPSISVDLPIHRSLFIEIFSYIYLTICPVYIYL